MEEVLIVVVQGLLELGLEFLIYCGLDFAALRGRSDEEYGCSLAGFFFICGAVLGSLANLARPRLLLPYPWLRIANLIIGPLLAGGASWLMTQWRQQRGAKVLPGNHFFFAFWFTLAFDLVRFAYGKH